MGLFNKKSAPVAETSYQDVVDYLRDINQQDYTKILKVVSTYREADKKVKKILNIKDEPLELGFSTDELLLDDDDTSLGNFLDDDQESTASKQQRKTAETATKPKAKSTKITVKQ